MKVKRILSMALVFCLCLSMIPTMAMPAEAATPGYTLSSSYKASSYYSALCNVTLTGNQRTDIVNVALSQVGYREGSYSGDYGGADDGSYNNYTEYNYWYHNYVSSGMPVGGDSAPWCAEQANIPSSILKRSTAAGHGASYFNVKFYSGSSTLASSGDNDSYFMGYNYTPKAGDLFFTRSWSHVGIVVAVNGSYVITVEGNTNTNGSSQGNGVYRLTSRRVSDLYFGVPNYTNTSVKHTVDTSYGTSFTAYPKTKITAENIFDAYHSQIDSTSWIGTSDKCTIHEVYTDGCCKVTYPLDAGGTKTVYSKISLFNTHTHSYTGSRYYESAHPHAITQRCVNYDTCGGWIYTGEYYEVKTCEQCWHADFDIGASSVSVKVGESKAVSVVLSGCLPDSAFLNRYFTPDNGVAEVTIQNQQLIFTGLKEGTTSFRMYLYSDSTKSHLLDAVSILVDVSVPTYTVSYNANGGSGAPGSQTKYYNTTLTLSSTKPTKTGYTFLGWSTSSTATSATYQPGGSFTSNANTTLYAVWKKGCEGSNHKFVYDVTGRPTSTSTGKIVGECGYCGTTTSVLLPKLNTNDYTYKVTKAATCTATGMGRYTWNTTTYGGSYYFDEMIPSTGHSYSYKATKVPTTSATGTLTGTCSKCSGTTTVTLSKLNTTDYTYKVTKAATCTTTGTGRYTWKTTTYGSFYFDVSISATGHNYSNGSCTRCGATDPNYVIEQNAARIDVENVEARVGETISVKISLKNNPGIVSIKLAVLYDSELLELVSAEGGVLENLSFGPSINNPFTVNWVDTIHPNNTTDGVVATLTFKVKDTAAAGVTSISISYDPDDVYNLDYENVKFLTSDGVVDIVDYIPGDISGDGKINNKDLGILMQWLNGYDVSVDELAADVNRDGKLNNKDYGILMQYLNGWDVTLK